VCVCTCVCVFICVCVHMRFLQFMVFSLICLFVGTSWWCPYKG